MTKEELYAIADNPIEFRMGKYMKEGFDIFKKNIGGFIGILIVSFILYFILALIPILGALLAPFFIVLMHAGVLITMRKIKNNDPVQFSDFFSGFSKAGPVITLGVIIFLMFLLCMVPAFAILFTQGSSFRIDPSYLNSQAFTWVLFLSYIPMIFLAVVYIFSMHVLLFINDNFWVAMEASRKVAFKKFFPILGMLFLTYLISIIGTIITLGLGLFVLIPWFHGTISAAFEDIYKPAANTFETKIDSFGSFERDINTEADEKKL